MSTLSQVTLECDAEGVPTPIITWFKNQRPIEKSVLDPILTRRGSIQLPAVTIDDAGRYACHVENEYGSEERSIVLNVYLAPTIKTTNDESLTLTVFGHQLTFFYV